MDFDLTPIPEQRIHITLPNSGGKWIGVFPPGRYRFNDVDYDVPEGSVLSISPDQPPTVVPMYVYHNSQLTQPEPTPSHVVVTEPYPFG